MRLTDASVAIRPRSAWEALDLGTLMARRQLGLLMASWALLTLPVLALITALLWAHPGWALVAFWWLKPAFERLPLYILSRTLFGEKPTLRQALRALPGLLRPQLFATLTWRRFNPMRSFNLPVQQLEGLSGQVRSARLGVLGQRDGAAAAGLTLTGLLLELSLYLGLLSLLYLLLPQQLVNDLDWQRLVRESGGEWLWLEHLRNLLYALVLVLWEPIYVACGFSLYLNRRTALEAWDIELAFRRLRQRLTGSAYALLLGCVVLLSLPADRSLADEPAKAVVTAKDASEQPVPSPERLTHQALTGSQASSSIQDILDAPPFRNDQTVTRWRFGDEEKEKEEDPQRFKDFFDKLSRFGEQFSGGGFILSAFKVLLWALVISLIALLIWRYREWLRVFASRLGLPQRARRQPPAVMFGLEVTPESLPDDVASVAERLWLESPREALGLLYRALLSRLLHDYRLPLKGSHTEGEVLAMVLRLPDESLGRFSASLTRHWQNLAYGHQIPDTRVRDELCAGWRQQLAGEARA